MAGTRSRSDKTLITSVGASRTLDVETRTRRYLITMAIRTAGFLAFLVVPGWWKVVALAVAVGLPVIAVLLANNSDHRPPPVDPGEAPDARIALPPAETIEGIVEEDE